MINSSKYHIHIHNQFRSRYHLSTFFFPNYFWFQINCSENSLNEKRQQQISLLKTSKSLLVDFFFLRFELNEKIVTIFVILNKWKNETTE